MPKKTVSYKEPSDYFSADMKKALKEWEQKKARAQKDAGKTEKKGEKK